MSKKRKSYVEYREEKDRAEGVGFCIALIITIIINFGIWVFNRKHKSMWD